jgi:methylated-DNA-[protein]-cysteine S-methyltransferase
MTRAEISRSESRERPTDMNNMNTDSLESQLGEQAQQLDRSFTVARAQFAARAVNEGYVDVAYEDHETPLGTIRLGATKNGIVRVALPTEDHDEVLEELAHEISPRILHASRPELTNARRELDEYFAGVRHDFDIALDWVLARRFRREVLKATARIPYGQTSTYSAVASEAGSSRAVRAAGTALATNPLPILIPCHRVVRSDGALGAYRGGTIAKGQLLELERAL